jgi:phosphatidylethanolamine/phosphatidyl-N-methylethanolamine N-methyltransferase
MDLDLIRRLYGRGARIYDTLFGPLLDRGRRLAVEAINAGPARSVLEVGVGTGLSLPLYRRDLAVTGIDLSPEMLARARERARDLPQVRALLEMDAQQLAFADAAFEAVVAMYVAAVVPDMARLFGELKRVCAPGGDIVVVNHLAAEAGVLAAVDRIAAPLTRSLAVRSDLRLKTLIDVAGLEAVAVADASLGGYIKLVRFRNKPR